MKYLLYSPNENNLTEEEFFADMEFCADLGADLLLFPDKLKTPYDELLRGVDILCFEEVDYMLGSLFDFSLVSGMAGVFSATDDFGINYSIYANAEPYPKETYSKLYINHSDKKRPAKSIEGYDEFSTQLFEPIVQNSQKTGILSGNDLLNDDILSKYIKNGVKIILNPCDETVSYTEKELVDISLKNNIVIISCNYKGKAFCITPKRGAAQGERYENVFAFEINNKDYN